MLNLTQSVISVLTALITGGLIIILIDVGNKKNRAYDNYKNIMQPYLEKLSAYCRFVTWYYSSIDFLEDYLSGHSKKYYDSVEFFRREGGKLITSGGNFPISYFTYDMLSEYAQRVSDVWYQYDKIPFPKPIRINDAQRDYNLKYIQTELELIHPRYLKHIKDATLLPDLSSEFFTQIYQPIKDEIEAYSIKEKLYKVQTNALLYMIGIIALLIAFLLFFPYAMWLPYLSMIISLLMLFFSLLMLSAGEKKQLIILNKLSDFFSNLTSYLGRSNNKCK